MTPPARPGPSRTWAATAAAAAAWLPSPDSAQAQLAPRLHLAGLDGTNGAQIGGPSSLSVFGSRCSDAGDFDGDGLDDLVIGARGVATNGADAGAAYLLFGQSNALPANRPVSALASSEGFPIFSPFPGDRLGSDVSRCDFNGDGLSDLILGAYGHNSFRGRVYVVFGRTGGYETNFTVSMLNGSNGFVLEGVDVSDFAGAAVAGGDWNGDGLGDVAVGAIVASPTFRGAVYLVFGTTNVMPATFDLETLDGTNGFAVFGETNGGNLGFALDLAPDLNGDALEDLVIGAPRTAGFDGAAYVLFGSNAAPGPLFALSSLDGANGFAIRPASSNALLGVAVAGVGDVNGDGFGETVAGSYAGAHMIFGGSSFEPEFLLGDLDGANGSTFVSGSERVALGFAGDVNGDALCDFLIGVENASPVGPLSGSSYLVFGATNGFPSEVVLDQMGLGQAMRLDGSREGEYSGTSVSKAGDFNGDGRFDFVIGARLASNEVALAGAAYVVFDAASLPETPAQGTTAGTGSSTGGSTTSAGSSSGTGGTTGGATAGASTGTDTAGGSSSSATGTTTGLPGSTAGGASAGSSSGGAATGTVTGTAVGSTTGLGGTTAGDSGTGTATATGGATTAAAPAPCDGLPELPWTVELSRPRSGSAVRFKSGKRGIGTAKGKVSQISLPAGATALRVQLAVVPAASLAALSNNPCHTGLVWSTPGRVGKVTSKGTARFTAKRLGAAAALARGDAFELWVRAGTNFGRSSSPTNRTSLTVR